VRIRTIYVQYSTLIKHKYDAYIPRIQVITTLAQDLKTYYQNEYTMYQNILLSLSQNNSN
jgi:hypothetical protein